MPDAALDAIRAAAAKYPEAERTFLFGDHEVYRVRKKVFIWLGDAEDGGTYVSVKLKETQDAALTLPFTEPASYGMAKWGWIGATFPKGRVPLDMVLQWMDESYRYTAPKKLLKQLDAPSGRTVEAPSKKRAAASTRAKSARATGKRRRG